MRSTACTLCVCAAESEKREPTYDLSHPRMYIETCKRLNIIPASFVMRHLASEKIIMPHHGLGPLGAKALCVPLLSNTVCLELNLEDNWLGDKGGVYVAEMMKENCYIVRLNVAGNRLGRVGGMAISSMLAVSKQHMVQLPPPSSCLRLLLHIHHPLKSSLSLNRDSNVSFLHFFPLN